MTDCGAIKADIMIQRSAAVVPTQASPTQLPLAMTHIPSRDIEKVLHK